MDLGGEVSTLGVSYRPGGSYQPGRELSAWGVSYGPGGSYQPGGLVMDLGGSYQPGGLVIDCCFKMGCTNHLYTPFRIMNGCYPAGRTRSTLQDPNSRTLLSASPFHFSM